MNIQELVIQEIAKVLSNKFDDLIVEGLNRKVFEFKNILEAESFIKENCKCEHYSDEHRRVFYVKNEPFLLHDYKIEMSDIDLNNGFPKINASYGSYAYL